MAAYTKEKKSRFSYSKLNCFDSCGWKYDLTYNKGHYIFSDSLASELGTLVHYIEEHIAMAFKEGVQPDYEQLKKDFEEINIPKTSPFDNDGGVYGLQILRQKYPEEFFKPDETGSSYHTKTLGYLDYGIYRLENYLKSNPNLKIWDMEKYFSVDFDGHILSGYIDRIFYDEESESYIIEDIKTKAKPFKDTELTTPMQFVIYVYALSSALNIPQEKIRCAYDLPFCDMKQEGGTNGYMNRGIKKLNKMFSDIKEENFVPSPSPLCLWCQFSALNPNQPEEGKMLCPYYSLWTRENKSYEVRYKWEGKENHEKIMEKFITEQTNKTSKDEEEFDF